VTLPSKTGFQSRVAAFSLVLTIVATAAAADAPVTLHVQTLTVPPSTQPVMSVEIQNQADAAYEGVVALVGPESWRIAPASRQVTLAAKERCLLPFSIEQGRNVASNQYPFEVSATSSTGKIVHRQTTFVASAPYYKPTIDGRADEWKDAIPIAFETGGKTTQISTYWNRRQFSLLVAVQEPQWVPYADDESSAAPDAIQVAISPLRAAADESVNGTAGRFEFLIAAAEDGARCFQLASMDTPLDQVREARRLNGLVCDDVDVVIRREGDLTTYECSFPFGPMRDQLRPMEGREFSMSVLVHDPDGTGIRDLGLAAGLPASPTDADAWCRWPQASWGQRPPRGNNVRWGLCTSKY
jgi:hypothetical protein